MGGMWASIAALAALWSAGPAAASADPLPQANGLFNALGGVTAASQGKNGSLFLTLWDPHVRYRLPKQPQAKLERLLVAIERANDGRAVKVRFDGARGQIARDGETVDYPLCAMAIDDLVFEPQEPCRATALPAAPQGAAALSLGIAFLTAGDPARAAPLLSRAGALADPAARKLLLRARADAAASIGLAVDERPGSEAADRQLVAALADYRALVALEPDDMDAQIAIGTTLEELGAYDEARAHLERLLADHPDENYRLRIRIGAVYRHQGRLDQALDQLNQLAAADGPPDGMRYHYHRGWTLTRLRHFDKAIAEFTAGIAQQPDYAWAYLRRSCAYASVGQLTDALRDAEQGTALMESQAETGLSRAARFDLDRARAIVAELKQAAEKEARPLPQICGGWWGLEEDARPRSALLPGAR